MITLYVGDSLDPREVIVSPEVTVKEVLTSNGIQIGNGTVTADGRKLGDAELNQTLQELSITDGTFLTVSMKMQSAR